MLHGRDDLLEVGASGDRDRGFAHVLVRAREPVPDLELAKIVQRVRNIFLLLGCVALIMLSVWLIQRPAPPDHDTSLSGLAAGVSRMRA